MLFFIFANPYSNMPGVPCASHAYNEMPCKPLEHAKPIHSVGTSLNFEEDDVWSIHQEVDQSINAIFHERDKEYCNLWKLYQKKTLLQQYAKSTDALMDQQEKAFAALLQRKKNTERYLGYTGIFTVQNNQLHTIKAEIQGDNFIFNELKVSRSTPIDFVPCSSPEFICKTIIEGYTFYFTHKDIVRKIKYNLTVPSNDLTNVIANIDTVISRNLPPYFVLEKSGTEPVRISKNNVYKELFVNTQGNQEKSLHEMFLDHPFIAQAKPLASDGVKALLEMPRYKQDLEQLIKEVIEKGGRFTEEGIKQCLAQLTLALNTMHTKNVAHRDIKDANIFITRLGNAVVGDLGLASSPTESIDKLCLQCGTPYTMAPEIYEGKIYDGRLVDAFSLGCVLYKMMYLKNPFKGKTMFDQLNDRKIFTESSMPHSHYSDDLVEICFEMLSYDPLQRCTVQDLMNDPFLADALKIAKSHFKMK